MVLVARLAAVSGPVLLVGRFRSFLRGTIPVLTWGGLRGGISVALALSASNLSRDIYQFQRVINHTLTMLSR